jgi:O-antigen/teichoic acid export membrane protein
MISVCITWILMSDAVMGAAVDMGVLRLAPLRYQRDPRQSLEFQQAALIMKPLGALALGLPILALAQPLSQALFQTPSGGHLLFLSMISVIGLLIMRSVQVHFQVTSSFVRYGVTDLLHSFFRFGPIALLLLSGHASPTTVLLCYSVAPFLLIGALLPTAARRLMMVTPSRIVCLELWRTVRWYLATTTLGSIIARMDIFLVSLLAGIRQAGIFAAAQVIALIPQLIGMYIAVVYAPRIMPLLKAGTLAPAYWRFQKRVALASVGVYVATFTSFKLQWLPSWGLPESFRDTPAVILILLPAALCALYSFPYTISLLLFTRPTALFAFDFLSLPLLLICYTCIIPSHGAIGAAAVTSGFSLSKTAFMQALAYRVLKSQGGDFLPPHSIPSMPGGSPQ